MPNPSADPREIKISWSRIRNHEECTEKSWLLSQGKRSPVTDVRSFFRGTVVDRAMRDWLNLEPDSSGLPPAGWMASRVGNLIEDEERRARETGDGIVAWKSPSDKVEVHAWCVQAVARLEPLLVQYVLPYNYQPAVRFEVELTLPYLDGSPQKIKLIGEMDLLLQEIIPAATLTRIFDLKATEDTAYWRKVLGQLLFYEIVAFIMFHEWPEKSGIIQPMCPDPVLSWTFTMDDRRQMFARIEKVARDMWLGRHAPKAGVAGCDRCEVKHACPKWAVPGRGRAPLPA